MNAITVMVGWPYVNHIELLAASCWPTTIHRSQAMAMKPDGLLVLLNVFECSTQIACLKCVVEYIVEVTLAIMLECTMMHI